MSKTAWVAVSERDSHTNPGTIHTSYWQGANIFAPLNYLTPQFSTKKALLAYMTKEYGGIPANVKAVKLTDEQIAELAAKESADNAESAAKAKANGSHCAGCITDHATGTMGMHCTECTCDTESYLEGEHCDGCTDPDSHKASMYEHCGSCDGHCEADTPAADVAAEFKAWAEEKGLVIYEGEDADDTVHEGEVVDDSDLNGLADTANKYFEDSQSAGHDMVVAAWNCGAALARAKELVAHGEFKPWVENNFDGSYRLAATYMQIASNVEKSELSQHNSINEVLKAIAAGKSGGEKAARTLSQRSVQVAKAAAKLAKVIEELADDIGSTPNVPLEDWEAFMNENVATPLTDALETLDKLWGVA